MRTFLCYTILINRFSFSFNTNRIEHPPHRNVPGQNFPRIDRILKNCNKRRASNVHVHGSHKRITRFNEVCYYLHALISLVATSRTLSLSSESR